MNSKEYIDLRLEQLKLKGAESTSSALGATLAWVLIIAVALLAISVLSFAGILFIGKALDNYALGALIVAGVLLVLLFILILCRKVLFRSSFIKLLSGKKTLAELQRAEELNAVRLDAAQSQGLSWIEASGLRLARIILRSLSHK